MLSDIRECKEMNQLNRKIFLQSTLSGFFVGSKSLLKGQLDVEGRQWNKADKNDALFGVVTLTRAPFSRSRRQMGEGACSTGRRG